METNGRVLELVYEAVEEVNKTLKAKTAVARSPDTILLGDAGQLDSLHFVNFLVALEERIGRAYQTQVNLIDVMQLGESTEWTVARLSARLEELLERRQVPS